MSATIAIPSNARTASSRVLGGYLRALRGDPCAYCGARSEALDHVHPRDSGGDNSWENLTGACHSCNSAKAHLTLLAFLGRRRGCDPLPSASEVVHLLQPRDIAALVKRAWRGVGA